MLTPEQIKRYLMLDPSAPSGVRWRGSHFTAGHKYNSKYRITIDKEVWDLRIIKFVLLRGGFPLHPDAVAENGAYMPAKLVPKVGSGHLGIAFDEEHNRWAAYILANGNRYFIGLFDSEEEALTAARPFYGDGEDL